MKKYIYTYMGTMNNYMLKLDSVDKIEKNYRKTHTTKTESRRNKVSE